jgi:hypothetical protein
MKRILRIVTVGLAFFVVAAMVEAPVHGALAQTSVKQVRAKKAKAQRQLPAAREPARQAAPAAQVRTPAHDPASGMRAPGKAAGALPSGTTRPANGDGS